MTGALGSAWNTLRAYLGSRGVRRRGRLGRPELLEEFLASRASHVAQSALYGYLRARAGMRYPVLFDDDLFVASLNIAKWQVWLACVSDLAVFAGGRIRAVPEADDARVGALMEPLLERLLTQAGQPADAGPAYEDGVERVRRRIRGCTWRTVDDAESAFVESPAALVRWAPVVEELKALDRTIVENSVRFRWVEVRRELRRRLDAPALLRNLP